MARPEWGRFTAVHRAARHGPVTVEAARVATASLTGLAGQTVRIQFEAPGLASAGLLEAGVDDVTITKT
ncbi:hypothetical protein Misp03_31600 [Microbispora sp. NBRC 16548]|nr:hypothetical protein Misp03_31600 [Microbispora sp. NBRC 16548]